MVLQLYGPGAISCWQSPKMTSDIAQQEAGGMHGYDLVSVLIFLRPSGLCHSDQNGCLKSRHYGKRQKSCAIELMGHVCPHCSSNHRVVAGRITLPPESTQTVVAGEKPWKGPGMPSPSLLQSCASQQMVGIAPAPSSRLLANAVRKDRWGQEGWEGLE